MLPPASASRVPQGGAAALTFLKVHEGLIENANPLRCNPMKFLYAMAAWVGIGLVLGLGLYWFSMYLMTYGTPKQAGTPWLFVISVIGLIVAVGKIGCKTH